MDKQTLKEAVSEYIEKYVSRNENASFSAAFKAGAEWQANQSPWISVEERLPDKGQRVLVGFLYYYKYADREAESRKYIDVFTYENGIWTNDSGISYLGKNVEKGDIKVICWMPISAFR